jgi:hypothetical protein
MNADGSRQSDDTDRKSSNWQLANSKSESLPRSEKSKRLPLINTDDTDREEQQLAIGNWQERKSTAEQEKQTLTTD